MASILGGTSNQLEINDLGFQGALDTTTFAINRSAIADGYIQQLGDLTASLAPPTISAVFSDSPTSPALAVDSLPATQVIVWTAPAIPDNFTGTIDTTTYFPAPFDENPPDLILGAVPLPPSDPVPDSPPIDLIFDDPVLDLNLPAVPVLINLQTVNFAGVTLPTLDAVIPTFTAIAPAAYSFTPSATYTSTLLTYLKSTLQDRIQNGGTGLPPAVENAIWDRGREREYRAAADALAELDRMESLGYAFPPGVFVDARAKVQTEMGYNQITHSREVMIKQAELEQTNVLQALEKGVQLEGILIGYTNNVEQRIFDSMKFATQSGIELYNSQVKVYEALVDVYKTKVAIYDAQIRGALADVEVYKIQIQAESIKAEINTSIVQQYKVQVDAALSAVEVYRAEIQAIQTKAEIEKIKVEVFGEQVRAYLARVNVFTAQVEGYRASLQAEGTKQEAYKTKVEAFKAKVDAGAAQSDAKVKEYQAQVQAKEAEYQRYKSTVDGETARVQAIVSSNQTVADLYKASVTGKASYNEVLTKQWQVAVDQAQRVTEIGVQSAKANADLYLTTRSLALDAAKVGAQVEAQISAAALSAVNWSTHRGRSDSTQQSFNNSSSDSVSQSGSVSTVYSYSF